MNNMIAFCGLNCTECPAFKATRKMMIRKGER